jgi:hypothetical protein
LFLSFLFPPPPPHNPHPPPPPPPRECIEAMDQLARAVDEVRIEIAGLLRTG